MAEHSDVKRIRKALAARGKGGRAEAALLNGLFADDVVWHGAVGGGRAGLTGKAKVLEQWRAFATDDSGPSLSVDQVFADGVHAAAIVELTSGGRKKTTVRQANIFHVGEDGKVSEIWGLPTDAAIVDAFAKGKPVPTHKNVAPFLAAEQARQRTVFDAKDMKLISRFLADNVRWYMGGRSTWAATPPASLADVIFRFKMFKLSTNGTLFFDIHEVFADDTHAASFVTLTADHPTFPDRHMNVEEVNIFHLDKTGRAFEFWGIPTDEAERDAFWADNRDIATRRADTARALGLPALLTKKGTNGALTMLDVHLPTGTMLAPVHTHTHQDEASFVLEGEISFYLGGEVHRVGPGGFQYKPKNIPHTIFNDSGGPVRFLEFCWPGGLDEYLEDMADLFSHPGPPDFKKIAAIAKKHRIVQDFQSIVSFGEKYGVRQVGS